MYSTSNPTEQSRRTMYICPHSRDKNRLSTVAEDSLIEEME